MMGGGIPTGDSVLVAGPSGSGKSVTAYTVMGLHPKKELTPVAGEILLEGTDLDEQQRSYSRVISSSAHALLAMKG